MSYFMLRLYANVVSIIAMLFAGILALNGDILWFVFVLVSLLTMPTFNKHSKD